MTETTQKPSPDEDGEPQNDTSAVTRFCDGFSCSQAVLSSYADRYGLDQQLAMRLSSGLGGGLGRMGGTCGAVSGASLVLGLELGGADSSDKAAKEKTYDAVRSLQEQFSEKHGTTQCNELLQCDVSDSEQYARAREQDLFKASCPGFVGSAVEILDELLSNQAKK